MPEASEIGGNGWLVWRSRRQSHVALRTICCPAATFADDCVCAPRHSCVSKLRCSIWNEPAVSAVRGLRDMDELVDRIVANVGVDRPVAEKAAGIIFDFLP